VFGQTRRGGGVGVVIEINGTLKAESGLVLFGGKKGVVEKAQTGNWVKRCKGFLQ